MPLITLSVPEPLLMVVVARAKDVGKTVDQLYIEAVERYIRATKNASPGAVRSRYVVPGDSPQFEIDVPEAVLDEVGEAAKRQEKPPPRVFLDAMLYHLKAAGLFDEAAPGQMHETSNRTRPLRGAPRPVARD